MPTRKQKASVRGKTKIVMAVDKKVEAEWKEQLARFIAASERGAAAWDERYEIVTRILENEPPLYIGGGFSTDAEFLKAVVREDRTSLYRNMRVAKYANADEIEKYSPSRLDLAITLVETQNGGPLKGRNPIAFEKLRFSFKHEGKLVTRPFTAMSVDELRAAVAHLKGRDADSKTSSPAAREINSLIKKSKVAKASFSISSKVVTIRVPLDDLAKVASALASFTPPKK